MQEKERMKKTPDNVTAVFEKFHDQWDVLELNENNYDRFLAKRMRKNKWKKYGYPISIAAAVLLFAGYFTFFNTNESAQDLTFASKETQQTDSIFTSMIRMELDQVKEKKSPLNEKIVSDALVQMQILDADYEKIKLELLKNGENKQIIYAMIRNLQTRISFLENVLQQIETTENLKNTTDEKTM